jgi:hypothetical protein
MKSLTVDRCLSRAERLRLMADGAKSYEDILMYETLAEEWLVLAGRLAPAEAPSPAKPNPPICIWQNFRSWFRILESLGQGDRGKYSAR